MKKVMLFVIALFASVMIMPSAFALDEVATVDGTNYTTLQEAIDNADGKTVTLLTDVTESVTIAEGKTVTLDLGSYTLTNKEGKHTITNEGNLTVTGSGTVDNVSHGKAAVYNSKTGTANLTSGTYTRSQEKGSSAEQSGGNSYYTLENHGNMTIKASVKVLNSGSFSSLLHNGFYDGSKENPNGSLKPTLTIDGGLFDGGLNTVKNDDDGVLVINDGTFTNIAQAAVLNWNNTTINGGNFNAGKSVILNGKLDDTRDAGILIINGGNFEAGTGSIIAKMGGSHSDYAANILISGGTFNKTVEQMPIDENKEVITDENGNYIVKYKKANYDKIDELLEKVDTINMSNYTDESVNALENVINNIDYDKTVLEQDEVDTIATDLENAIDALTLKKANYDKVNEFLNKINNLDKDKYTKESLEALDKVINNIDYNKTILEQADVDQLATDLESALNALVVKETPKQEEKTEEVTDVTSNPKTSDGIAFIYAALLISVLGMGISLKKLA